MVSPQDPSTNPHPPTQISARARRQRRDLAACAQAAPSRGYAFLPFSNRGYYSLLSTSRCGAIEFPCRHGPMAILFLKECAPTQERGGGQGPTSSDTVELHGVHPHLLRRQRLPRVRLRGLELPGPAKVVSKRISGPPSSCHAPEGCSFKRSPVVLSAFSYSLEPAAARARAA